MGLDQEKDNTEEAVEEEAQPCEENQKLDEEKTASQENSVVEQEEEEEEVFELVELELDEDDIVCYLEDEDGNRVGFVLMEDDEEVEYFYTEDEEVTGENATPEDEFDIGITQEGVKQATTDMNAIYKDGVAVAGELKGAFDDIREALDFSFLKKK